MILGRCLLQALVLNIKLSEHVVEGGGRTLKIPTAPMTDLGTYKFKILNTGKSTPEEYFMNVFVEELFESEHACTSNK